MNDDAVNVLSNALFLDGAGSTPDHWVPSYVSGWTPSFVSDPDFRGRAWQITGVEPSRYANLTGSSTDSGDWAVGDRLLFTAKVKVVDSEGVPEGSGLEVDCNFYGSTGVNVAARGLRVPGFVGRICHELVVPPGTTLVQLALLFNPSPTGTVEYRVGEAAVINLTRLGQG